MKNQDISAFILTDFSPFHIKEAYVRLRTNFIYTTMNGLYKKVVFTSCEAGEGKSTTVVNLAISLAKANKKVLVLDCDMRKSLLRKYMKQKSEKSYGLSGILSNLHTVEECIEHHDEYGFDIIYSGSVVPNPSEMLESDKMKELLQQMEGKYDYILLDAPPVLSVSDPVILSNIVDGVVFVVRHGIIKKKQLTLAIRALNAVGARILGTVFDQYNAKKDHSSYGYGGKYYYYYQRYQNDREK